MQPMELLPEDEKIIRLVHTALDTYPVAVYNGQVEKTQKPIGQAVSCISDKVQEIGIIVKEQTDLLKGTKQRRLIFSHVKDIFSIIKATGSFSVLKIIVACAAAATSIFGLLSAVEKIFNIQIF